MSKTDFGEQQGGRSILRRKKDCQTAVILGRRSQTSALWFLAILLKRFRANSAVTVGKHRPLAYYHTAAGVEIDFIVETRRRQSGGKRSIVCVEVKSAERWDPSWNHVPCPISTPRGAFTSMAYMVCTGVIGGFVSTPLMFCPLSISYPCFTRERCQQEGG